MKMVWKTYLACCLYVLGACGNPVQAGYLTPGTYNTDISTPDTWIWTSIGSDETFVFNGNVTLEDTGNSVSPVNVDGKLTLRVADGKTLSLLGKDTYHPIDMLPSGRAELTILGGKLDIETSSGANSTGVYMDDSTLTIANQSVSVLGGECAFKIHDDSVVSVTNSADFTAQGTWRGIAMQAHNGSGVGPEMTLRARNIIIDAGTTGGAAIYVLAYDQPGTGTRSFLTAQADMRLTGQRYGAYFYGNNTSELNAANITLEGGSYGLYTSGTSAMSDNDITVTASGSLAVAGGSGGLRNINGAVSLQGQDVSLSASNGYGVWSSYTNGAGTAATKVTGNRSLRIAGTNFDAVYSDNAPVELISPDIQITGDRYGVRTNGNAGNVAIRGNNLNVGSGNSSLNAGQNGVLDISTATVNLTSAMEPVWADTGGRLGIRTGRLNITTSDKNTRSVYAGSAGKVDIAVSGQVTLDGNLYAETEGSIVLNLPSGASSLTGWAIDSLSGDYAERDVSSGLLASGNVSLAMHGGSVWNVRPNADGHASRVSSLELDNSTVNLRYGNPVTLRAGNTAVFSDLHIRSLSGTGGVFLVDTDIVGETSDRVFIETGHGAHKLEVKPRGGEPSREEMASFIVRQEQGDASFSLANQGGNVEAGLYLYELASRPGADKADATEWHLRRAAAVGHGSTGPILTPTAETVLGLSGMAASYSMWYGQLSDLRERLGEIRYGTGTDGFWARGFAQKNKLDGLGGIDFDQNLHGGSMGYDHLYTHDENNHWLFGFRAQASRAEQTVKGRFPGSGDNDSYGFAGYAVWSHRDGWYADAVATWDHYKQEMRTRMLDGTRVNGSYNNNGTGASLESGKKITFSNGAFLEPQVQLSYYWLEGKSFSTSNGMRADQHDAHSLTGRAGLVAGKKWDFGDNGYVQPYLKAGVNHEFLGKQRAEVNGVDFSGDLRGTRAYYGAGADWQATDAVRLYAEFEREDGHRLSTPWSVSAGLRYEF